MGEKFDCIVVGMGPGGEVAASRLLDAGRSVAVVEQELIGGECAYWACIPSKTVLRPPEAASESDRAAGVGAPALDWPEARDYRDYMARHLDDSAQAAGYERRGAVVVRGSARLLGGGKVGVDGRELEAPAIILATGSDPVLPSFGGAAEALPAWSNRELHTARDLPRRALVVGGSATGVETASFLSRFGTEAIVVHRGSRLLGREAPRVGQLAKEHLEQAGTTVHLDAEVTGAVQDGDGRARLRLGDGTTVEADVLVYATGRTPRTDGLGLEAAGIRTGPGGGIVVDPHCRAAEGIWAIGDVTGTMPFTHVAKYQARVAAEDVLGRPRPARYEGIPRVVFADPEIAAAGITPEQARTAGIETAESEVDLAKAIARPWTYERDPRGHLGLLADRQHGVILSTQVRTTLAIQAGTT